MKKSKIFWLLPSSLFIILALAAASWIDPDFGWHYRLGEIIIKSRIPKTDPFSFTMPSYSAVDPSWLTNVLYYFTNNTLGYFSLALVHAVIFVSIPFIAIKQERKYSMLLFLPILLIWGSMVGRFGIRPQVIGWFFMALFVRVVYGSPKWKKTRWFLPPLILLWANFHISYFLGLILTIILIPFKHIRRKSDWPNVLVIILSMAAALITPFGVSGWLEVVKQMTLGGAAKSTISEWRPAIFSFEPSFLILIALTAALLFYNRKKIKIWEAVVASGGILAGLSSGRHIPLAAILIAPILLSHLEVFKTSIKNIIQAQPRFQAFYRLLVIIALIALLVAAFIAQKSLLKLNEGFYPQGAAEYMEASGRSHDVFADYSFGGYLIWKAPNQKYFVDGRMDGWAQHKVKGESGYAYIEYLDVLCGKQSLGATFDKYRVNTVIITKKPTSEGLGSTTSVISVLEDVFEKTGLIYCKNPINLENETSSLGWVVVYEDDLSKILMRP